MSGLFMVIAVICEGETEETFIKRILSPDLESHGKTLKPFLLGGLEQGGYPKLAKEVRKRLHERGIAYVTTMVDLYGLPKNFPQKSTAPSEPYERVQFLEEAFAKDIGNERFIPHIMLHEFETLLLAPPALKLIPERAKREKRPLNSDAWRQLSKEVQEKGAELINGGVNSHPAARLEKAWPGYKKTLDGIEILKAVSLEAVMADCTHFERWVKRLRGLHGA